MPTNVNTGRTCTVTINSVAYTDQITSATLTPSENAITGVVLSGPYAAKGTVTWTLDLEMVSDWGATSSICESLWTAADTGTNVSFTMVATTGATFAGTVVPVHPSVGGAADSAQTISISFPVHGTITETFT